jgi:S1-C subfamily serine protease
MRIFPASALLLSLACILSLGPAHAQEPSGLATVLAMEERVVHAIAQCERSVVAVARVRKAAGGGEQATGPASIAAPFFSQSSPLDPDFVPQEFGAGVVIDTAGLILTNYHVIGGADSADYFVWSQRRPFPAQLVAADPWYDLAVLRIAAQDLQPIDFGDASKVRKGQFVIALGNPQAIAADGEVSASWGIISNVLRRAPRVPDRSAEPQGRETLHHYGTLLQTDAKLNVGFSGGALIDTQGKMIGLMTSYTGGAAFEASAGFAIPVDASFQRTVEILKTGGEPAFGFLGAAPEPLAVEHRQQGRHGVRVVFVIPGTPAASAGLQVGDVITHVSDVPIYDDDDLFRVIGAAHAGSTAELRLLRGGVAAATAEEMHTSVVLTKKHVDALRPQVVTSPKQLWRGLAIDYATAAPHFNRLARELESGECVYVSVVEAESPAWNAGLRPGTFVSHVASRPTTTPQEFRAAVRRAEGPVELRVLSGSGPATLHTVSP